MNKFKIGDTVRIKLPKERICHNTDIVWQSKQYTEFYNRWHNASAIVIEVFPEMDKLYKLSNNSYWDERNLKHCRLDKLKRILQK